MNNATTKTTTTTTTPSPSPGPASGSPTQTTVSAGMKRKRSPGTKYYAVKVGFRPGVYDSWNDCLAQVTGYKGAVFQSFPTVEEANSFLTGKSVSSPQGGGGATPSEAEPSRFYAVQRGHVPGVYSDWAKAQEQIRGFTRPRYKKFSTRAQAEEFVRLGQGPGSTTSTTTTGSLPGAPGMTAENPRDENGVELPAGTGPLPPGAEDGFDPNIVLDPSSGKVVYKTKEQKAATKAMPTAPPGMLRIYTDGSALRNGSNGARAGVGVYFGPGDSRNVSEPLKGNRQTNQRAELTAILRALEIAPRHRDVTISTDSRYAIDCVTVWFVKWRRNKWLTADGKPVENKDLIESILVKIEERNLLKVKTLFEWVKGHNRDPGNEAADQLAVKGAMKRAATEDSADAPPVEEGIPEEVVADDDDL